MTERTSNYIKTEFQKVNKENVDLAINCILDTFPSLRNNPDAWFDIEDLRFFYESEIKPKGIPNRICLIVADEDGKAIGVGMAQQRTFTKEGVWDLPIICINTQDRQQNIGRNLVLKLISMAYEKGVKSFVLDTNLIDEKVSGGKSPVEFWKKLGFEEIGRKEGYYSGNQTDGVGVWLLMDNKKVNELAGKEIL